jgi:hypothetical protein
MTALRELTADEINTLASIIAKLRPTGARRWDPAGIRATLAKVANLDAANVITAAIRLSCDRNADTPGQIAIPSSGCWREKPSDWTPPTGRDICRDHGTARNALGICPSCRADELGTDTPSPPPSRGRLDPDAAADAIAALRDRLQAPATTGASSSPEETPA